MRKLDESGILTNFFVPKEGQRLLSSSDEVITRCPSLGFETENIALEYLAEVLVEAYLIKKKDEIRK